MTDYIPREAVLDFVEPDARPFLAERIKSIPAADVRPVVRVKWEEDWETGCSTCSACGESYLWEDYDGVGEWNYCPNCGADMRETRWTQIVCNKCGGKRFIARGDFVVCDKCGARMGES